MFLQHNIDYQENFKWLTRVQNARSFKKNIPNWKVHFWNDLSPGASHWNDWCLQFQIILDVIVLTLATLFITTYLQTYILTGSFAPYHLTFDVSANWELIFIIFFVCTTITLLKKLSTISRWKESSTKTVKSGARMFVAMTQLDRALNIN